MGGRIAPVSAFAHRSFPERSDSSSAQPRPRRSPPGARVGGPGCSGRPPGVAAVERGERVYVIRLVGGAAIAHLMGQIAERVAPRRLELARPTLEEVFFELVGAER